MAWGGGAGRTHEEYRKLKLNSRDFPDTLNTFDVLQSSAKAMRPCGKR